MNAELCSSCVIGLAAWGPAASSTFEPGANLTSIIIAVLGLIPIVFGIRNQRRATRERNERSDPPAAERSDPDATDHDLPRHGHRPGSNPRTNRR